MGDDRHVPGPPTPPASFLEAKHFTILSEIEPPRQPDMTHVHEQIWALENVVDAFLIPDNHLGRATVSSVSVAHEVAYLGGRSIACMNARDRNLLGFRRDLLTAASYGVDHFLFVYGDPPIEGRRTEDLTVRGMIDEVRTFGQGPLLQGFPDFLVQVTYARERLLRWREGLRFDGKFYPAVLVLASSRMAKRINASLPDIRIPERIIDKLDDDPSVGLDLAMDQIEWIRDTGAFDGVHLVPVSRFREVATRLADLRR
jgi:methylenetetrahydrofolate reductase (NADPH)